MPAPVARPEVLRAYWQLAAERQNIFFRRLAGQDAPWTDDPILSTYKFCNAYRASDRVSQYLIRHAIYHPELHLTAEDVLLRTVLFRLFSKNETWEALEQRVGPVTVSGFDFDRYDQALEDIRSGGQSIYTAAFILCANKAFGHDRKHRNHLTLLETMLTGGRLAKEVAAARGMSDLYAALRAYPLLGDFMAYQIATDINYSELTDFPEHDFTVAGPGAQRGIRKVFADRAGWTDQQIILWMTDTQAQQLDELNIDFCDLWGRPLQAIDCQNLFCETDKYARVAFPHLASNRTKIKQTFTPTGPPAVPFYPPKWGLNNRLAQLPAAISS